MPADPLTDPPNEQPAPSTETLVIEPLDAQPAERHTLRPGPSVTLGRGAECDIVVSDPRISKEHARLEWRRDAWYVTDLGSHNGTYVNERPTVPHEPARLRDGDLLSLGPCRIRLHRGGPSQGDALATRPSIFLVVRDDSTQVREVGWREFRDRYAPVIVGFARNAGLRAQDADDVLQDVMLGFFRVAPRYEYDPNKGRFRGYLKRATLNAMRKRARGERLATMSLDAPLDGSLDTPGRDVADASDRQWEEQWEAQLLSRAVEEARGQVAADTFEAFDLYARRGVPAAAVAERLGVSTNSVHQAKSRVQRLIHEIVERLRAEEG